MTHTQPMPSTDAVVRRGDRFMLRHDLKQFPDVIVPKGAIGTVIYVFANGMVIGRVDNSVRNSGTAGTDLLYWDEHGAFLIDAQTVSETPPSDGKLPARPGSP